MELMFRSVALIQKTGAVPSQFLLHSDNSSDHVMFVVAERLGKESFREAVTREVAWQLDLDRRKDFLVSSMAQLSKEYLELSPIDQSQVHVAVAFYSVQIYRNRVIRQLDENPRYQWVSAAEICAGYTERGETIDPQVVKWINRWRVVEPWH